MWRIRVVARADLKVIEGGVFVAFVGWLTRGQHAPRNFGVTGAKPNSASIFFKLVTQQWK